MATGSAFGFSAYDPVGSYFEGSINSYFDKKAESRAYERQLALMEAQYDYAQRYAENTPSWQVKGLRDAGLNPILAVSNGVTMGGSAPIVPSASSHRSPNTSKASFSGTGLLPFDRRITKQNADSHSLMAQAADKQGEAALIKANTDRSRLASDVAKTLAETELTKQKHERGKGDAGYRQDWMADVHRVLLPFYESAVELGKKGRDFVFERLKSEHDSNPYLQHGPLRSIEPTKVDSFKPKDDGKEYYYNGRKYRFRTIPRD